MIIELLGKSYSKKNLLSPGGKGKGYHYPKNVKAAMDSFQLQVPWEARDLNLIHPEVVFEFTVPEGKDSQDRDGLYTFVLDILTKTKVFADDNIRNHNGKTTLLPTKFGERDEYSVKISINE